MSKKIYKKIIVLGSIGSGKTSLSKKISKLHHIPVYHLDKEYWLPNWKRPDEKMWREKLNALSELDSWIMDGNYIESLDIRLKQADLVIMLDIHQKKCIRGIFFRTLKGIFFQRKDLNRGCRDAFNREYRGLIEWAKAFKKSYYPLLMDLCQQYKDVDIKIFKTRHRAKQYVKKELNNE